MNQNAAALHRSTTKRKPCPRCDRGPRDTALAVTINERGMVSYCHRCGYVATETSKPQLQPANRAVPAGETLDWSARAESIWQRTRQLRGTLGQTYLEYRGCALPPHDSHVRYLPSNGHYPPSLCSAISDALTTRPISLHFTRLAPDGKGKAGTDRDKLLLAGHRKRGGCIRLWPDECVTRGLAVAEGIETALAAAHTYTPIWSMIDCASLAALPVLAEIEALTIFADNDEAGLRAARECAQRWDASGRAVRIRAPITAGHDAADEVQP